MNIQPDGSLPHHQSRRGFLRWIGLGVLTSGGATVTIACHVQPPISSAVRSRTTPLPNPPLSPTPPLLVGAAMSLKPVLEELGQRFRVEFPQIPINYHFGATGTLQHQIQTGAPIDIFIAAATAQMDALQNAQLLQEESRQNLLTNRLVLITHLSTDWIIDLSTLTDPRTQRIAIGEPQIVPAGTYAMEVFQTLNLWDSLRPKLVFGNTVRQVLTFVETGNAEAGIVYTTDTQGVSGIRIVQKIPEQLHTPIVYPIAILKRCSQTAMAQKYVGFLSSDRARLTFQKYGFHRITE